MPETKCPKCKSDKLRAVEQCFNPKCNYRRFVVRPENQAGDGVPNLEDYRKRLAQRGV